MQGKVGRIVLGGGYFSDKRLGFFNKTEPDHIFHAVNWENVYNLNKLDFSNADYCFVFGIKNWTRRLKKKGLNWKKITDRIVAFLEKNIPEKMPMGVLDDCNLVDEEHVGDRLREKIFAKFNCKVFLLREYLKGKAYDNRVIPFSIPCKDNTHMTIPNKEKSANIYFHGDASHPTRARTVRKIRRLLVPDALLSVYTGGENSDHKMPYENFLGALCDSKVCLSFMGAGYCCFRYQEIASVGSIIATPEYPHVIRNDYINGVSCIKYKDPGDIVRRLSNPDDIASIRESSLENFKKYHTSEVRYSEWLGYLDEVCRN